jgi:hypothetical protein
MIKIFSVIKGSRIQLAQIAILCFIVSLVMLLSLPELDFGALFLMIALLCSFIYVLSDERPATKSRKVKK